MHYSKAREEWEEWVPLGHPKKWKVETETAPIQLTLGSWPRSAGTQQGPESWNR
jgi:hypothetical protein